MAKKPMEPLTESMFYLLMALCQGPLCGADAAAWIEGRTGGRLRVGPATLYTLLAKFQKEKLIREVSARGRRRTYAITPRGLELYRAEVARLERCLRDAGLEEPSPAPERGKEAASWVPKTV